MKIYENFHLQNEFDNDVCKMFCLDHDVLIRH